MRARADETSGEHGTVARRGLWADYLVFLRWYKAWYLVPILVVLGLLALLLLTRGSTVSPFEYEL